MRIKSPPITLIRASLIALAVTFATGLSACVAPHDTWTGGATAKRNTVELLRLTHDVTLVGDGTQLAASEKAKLNSFFESVEVGYGDELAIDPGDAPGAEVRWHTTAAYLRELGFSVRSGNALYGAPPGPGAVRIVVGRYVVTPPDCPDWSKPAARDYHNRPSSFLGCANTTNLGLMIANPRDLLQGRGELSPDTDAATRAVRLYREGKAKAPQTQQTSDAVSGGSNK